jgi:hypothetical protein
MKPTTWWMAGAPPGKAARAAWARAGLSWLLSAYVFDETPLATLPERQRLGFEHRLQDTLAPVAGPWERVLRPFTHADEHSAIADLEAARVLLRHTLSHLVSKQPYTLPAITVQQTLGPATAGFVRVEVHGTLTDAIVWAALRLVEVVPASLIRGCGVEACSQIYVASKNQKFCDEHQPEQRRLRQREAERAFRARAPKTQRKSTRKRTGR